MMPPMNRIDKWWCLLVRYTTVFRLRRYDHITDALAVLHWLRLQERVDYTRLLSWRFEHCMAWLRHTSISWFVLLICLVVAVCAYHHIPAARSYNRLATVGRRSFPIAASILWNSLPPDIQSSASLSIFCQRLKTHLFHQSFPDVLLQAVSVDYASVDFVITFVVLATLKIKLWLTLTLTLTTGVFSLSQVVFNRYCNSQDIVELLTQAAGVSR